jgi:hypothetical protein
MKWLPLAALLVLAAACRKSEPAKEEGLPTKAVVAGERLIDFDEQHGAFACQAPAAWKAVEDDYSGGPLVMFFGPAGGPRRAKVSISVSRYPDRVDKIKTPQDFVAALKLTDQNPGPLETRVVGGRTVYAVHYDDPQVDPRSHKTLGMNREDTVLIPQGEGFFAVSHTAPADDYRRTLPIFEAVVSSFEPKK